MSNVPTSGTGKATVQEKNAEALALANITVRQLRAEDVDQIAPIARAMPAFTEPSPYVVWMLSRTQGGLCQVAVDPAGEVLGYVLAVVGQQDEVFVWQLGLTSAQAFPALPVACELISASFSAASNMGRRRLRFTASGKAFNGLIRRVLSALEVQAESVGCVAAVTSGTAQPEFEYLVKL